MREVLRPIRSPRRRIIVGLSLFMSAASFMLLADSALGVMRQDGGDGLGAPGGVAPIFKRVDEFLDDANRVRLAAIPAYVYQYGISGSPTPSHAQQAKVFVDRIAEGILAQFPADLALQMHRFYYYGDGLTHLEPSLGQGGSDVLVQGRYLSGQEIQVAISPILKDFPLLEKMHRIAGMVQSAQANMIMRYYPRTPYRLKYPIIQAINKMTTWLLLEEMMQAVPQWILHSEISKANAPQAVKKNLSNEYLTEGYVVEEILAYALELKMMGFNESSDEIASWFQYIEGERDTQSESLPNEKQLTKQFLSELAHQYATEGQTNRQSLFRRANEARKAGDSRSAAILQDLIQNNPPNQCRDIF